MSSITSASMSIGDRIQNWSEGLSWLAVSRLRAFAGHLAISTALVGGACVLVFLLWYPQPYFEAVGAWSIIRILVGVDLVLGPLLTLIVFRPGKRLLIVDMALIAIIQVSALTYGLSVLHEERPYYAVFALDRIQILAQKDIEASDSPRPDWLSKPMSGPILASARRPDSVEAQQRLIEETLFGGAPDIERRPEFWVPLRDDLDSLRQRVHRLSVLRNVSEDVARQVDLALSRAGLSEAEAGFLPVQSAKNDASAILNTDTGTLIAVLATDPWEALLEATR